MDITARTNYRVTGENFIQVYISARRRDFKYANRLDKPFVAESYDGGNRLNLPDGWFLGPTIPVQ